MNMNRLPFALLVVATWCHASESLEAIAEPAAASAVAPRKPERNRWAWNQPMASITATGDLAWQPEPYRFQPGQQVRYIDAADGHDDQDGSRDAPWKHHPWDAAATGKAKAANGPATYVFKRGVIYRGQLVADESGTLTDPIQLTSDPAWGEGEAVLSGCLPITGWTRGSDEPGMPEGGLVWWADCDFLPRNLWMDAGGTLARIPLARTPNWTVSDPEDVMSEWWTWEQPEWWTGKWKVDWQGHRAHLGIDTKHLTQGPDYYVGATVRTEYGIVMGTPFPTIVEGYDAARKGIYFQGIWTGDSEQILTGNRYYLEDKPHYLDSPGEFWVKRNGDRSRVYLRLPGDKDPNSVSIEGGRHCAIIESGALAHVHISGLSFRGTNTHWELHQPGWGHPDVANAAIRVRGSADGLRISHCRFTHIAGRALRIDSGRGIFGSLAVTDNEFVDLDHGVLDVQCGGRGDVQVLRNRSLRVGMRPHRQDHGHGITVCFPETMHIAGNIMDRSYGAGIFVFGGKGSDDRRDVPLARSLIHGNRVVDSLLAANDWGGIETWQCGPHYVFNNISGNANGYWNWAYKPDGPGTARLGFNYYFDGSFKNWVFNNVAWGRSSDPLSKHCSHAAFYQAVQTIENTFFNNTAFRFHLGSNWSPAGGRSLFLGNLWIDISGMVFQHGKLKEDKDPQPAEYPYHSIGFARNLFAQITAKTFGVFEANGSGHATLESMQAALAARKPLADDLGTQMDASPVRDAAGLDFRPAAGSPAIDKGVRVFVPWALARTVGEWQFRQNRSDPSVILDNSWYPSTYHVKREHYHRAPVWDLRGEGIDADDFIAGPLEDWCAGALRLDGTQRLVLSRATMLQTYTVDTGKDGRQQVTGAALNSPDGARGNLLIEMHLQPTTASGTLISTLDAQSGYRLALNRAGGATFTIAANGMSCSVASGAIIADGQWHHVVAELDREAKELRLYIDGRLSASAPCTLPPDANLSSTADLVVGHGFSGTLEFLRVARSSLAESRTSIEELYDWEFDGPFLRDFAGRAVSGSARDAGAFEAP